MICVYHDNDLYFDSLGKIFQILSLCEAISIENLKNRRNISNEIENQNIMAKPTAANPISWSLFLHLQDMYKSGVIENQNIMAKPTAANPISWSLFLHLQDMYKSGVEGLKNRQPFQRVKLNGFYPYSLSAFPLAIAAWEAFLNENCLSMVTESDYPSSILWDIREQADKWDTKLKAYLVPKLLFGQTFNKGSQPYQDFLLLVEIRNHITHFRLEEAPNKPLKDLAQRKITLMPPKNAQYSWSLQLQSTESVRWSINTIAKMVQALTIFFPQGQWPGNSLIFNEISESLAKDMFINANIDPDLVESDITEAL